MSGRPLPALLFGRFSALALFLSPRFVRVSHPLLAQFSIYASLADGPLRRRMAASARNANVAAETVVSPTNEAKKQNPRERQNCLQQRNSNFCFGPHVSAPLGVNRLRVCLVSSPVLLHSLSCPVLSCVLSLSSFSVAPRLPPLRGWLREGGQRAEGEWDGRTCLLRPACLGPAVRPSRRQ